MLDSTALSRRKADFPTKNSPAQWGFDEFPQPRKQLAEQNVGRTNFQGVIARRRFDLASTMGGAGLPGLPGLPFNHGDFP